MTYLCSPLDLPPAELCAMKFDGEVSSAMTFLDEPDTVQYRARRVLRDLEESLVLSSWSAAWAWGCATEPGRHHVAYRHERIHVSDALGLVVEQRSFHSGDIDGGVTTPLRTALDLLKSRELTRDGKIIVSSLMTCFDVTAAALLAHGRDFITAPHRRVLASNLAALHSD